MKLSWAALLITQIPRLAQGANLVSDRDMGIVREFAPIVINQEADYKANDELNRVLFDLAETETHIFLTYHVLHPFSVQPVMSDQLNSSLGGFARHFADTEDLLLVLRKGPDGRLDPVYLETNAHGDRLGYPVKGEVAEADLKNLPTAAKKFETGPLGLYHLSNEIRNTFPDRASDPFPEFAGTHPVVGSSANSHAMVRAGLKIDPAQLSAQGTLRIYVPEGFKSDLTLRDAARTRIEASSLNKYSFEWVGDVVAEMKFHRIVAEEAPLKTLPCRAMTLKFNGAPKVTPALPTQMDPVWFMEHYDKKLLETEARTHDLERGGIPLIAITDTDWDKLVSKPEANLYFDNGGKDDADCVRLDPVSYVGKILPATWAAQVASSDYVHYPLLDARPAVGLDETPVDAASIIRAESR